MLHLPAVLHRLLLAASFGLCAFALWSPRAHAYCRRPFGALRDAGAGIRPRQPAGVWVILFVLLIGALYLLVTGAKSALWFLSSRHWESLEHGKGLDDLDLEQLARTIHEHARQNPQTAGSAGLSAPAGTLETPASSTTSRGRLRHRRLPSAGRNRVGASGAHLHESSGLGRILLALPAAWGLAMLARHLCARRRVAWRLALGLSFVSFATFASYLTYLVHGSLTSQGSSLSQGVAVLGVLQMIPPSVFSLWAGCYLIFRRGWFDRSGR